MDILYTQKDDEKNLGFTSFTSIRPGGKDILFGLEKDGYLHHYLYNLEAKTLEQKTFGSCEDMVKPATKSRGHRAELLFCMRVIEKIELSGIFGTMTLFKTKNHVLLTFR